MSKLLKILNIALDINSFKKKAVFFLKQMIQF